MGNSLFAELKRRNVFKAGVAYLALGWVVTQVTSTVAPVLRMPDWIVLVVVWIGVIGFPFVIAFSWIYEITPEGLKRESDVDRAASITHVTGRRIDYLIVSLLVLAILFTALDRFVPRRVGSTGSSEATVPAAVSAGSSASSAGPTATPDATSDNSIAVLPFVDMSQAKDQEYFSDGISEELLNLLAQVPNLRVIARTSSFSFKGKGTPIKDIAQVLQVAAVLEGSVRKSGDKVRITVQLIRAKDSSHLWSETYDRTLDDIFKVQDEIAAAVVAQLKVKLLGAAPTAKPVDPKVYPLILQAHALTDQGSAEGFVQAISLNQQALAIAPNEARAWAELARAYLVQAIFGLRPAAEGGRLAKEAANKALELDAGNVSAETVLSRIAGDFEFDLSAAVRHAQRALELEPGNLLVLNNAAVLLGNIGRMNEALALFEYRVAHDPANPGALNNLGVTQYQAKQWQSSIDTMRAVIRLSPESTAAHATIGEALLLGMHDGASALKEIEAEPDDLNRMAAMPLALHALGRIQEGDAALRALSEKYGKEQPYLIALACAYRGQSDAAFEWLDKAAAIHDQAISQVLIEPLLDPLHSDARWVSLLRKLGKAPEQLATIEFKVTLPKEWRAGATAAAAEMSPTKAH
jgi:TolB-like protein